MIVCFCSKNEELISIVEKYLNDRGPLNCLNYEEIMEGIKFQQDIEEFDNLKSSCPKRKSEAKRLSKVIEGSFEKYLNDLVTKKFLFSKYIQENKESILNNINIFVTNMILDTDFRRKKLYWFPTNQKYIIM